MTLVNFVYSYKMLYPGGLKQAVRVPMGSLRPFTLTRERYAAHPNLLFP